MEIDNSKPLEEKNIIEKFTNDKGEFKIGSALLYQEQIIKKQEERILGLEEAMQFFSEWYNKTQRANILVPEHLTKENPSGLIL